MTCTYGYSMIFNRKVDVELICTYVEHGIPVKYRVRDFDGKTYEVDNFTRIEERHD